MSSESFARPAARNLTEVFAVHGADPEVLAFAMAKYSRSSLSMRESLAEISAQRAEQFLNTFYFQYGHRSIADLAHIAFAVERLSLMAAIVLVDEQRWDGQERSTRYQNFLKSGWYLPDFGQDSESEALYRQSVESLFSAYQATTAAVLNVLRSRIARPEVLKPEAYERTLKARAFDVARYLLPLATNTSLGQIVSARTLEGQIARLLSHPAAEVRDLGAKLREAATGPAWNVNARAAKAFVEKLAAFETQGSGTGDHGSRVAKPEDRESGEAALNDHEFLGRRDDSHSVETAESEGALNGPGQETRESGPRADEAANSDGALQVAEKLARAVARDFSPGITATESTGALQAAEKLARVVGRDFSPGITATESAVPLQAAEKLVTEGGGGFNPRISATESTRALAPDALISPISPPIPGFSAASLAPEASLAAEAADLLMREVRTAPTLVKYAQSNPYEMETRATLAQAAAEFLRDLPVADAPLVDLVERTESLEVELAATLLYSASHHPYRQIRDLVAGFPAAWIPEIVALGVRDRGKHDETLRAFHAGAALRFDILMDIGGFRDLHRHRRCTQIIQGFTAEHGYETPGSGDLPAGPKGDFDILAEAGVLDDYQSAIESAHRASAQIAASAAPEAAQSALYLLPLATRIRALFKMDLAEAQYICELRSAPAGHFSYRRVAWEMYRALERQHPALAKHIRVTDFTKPIDMLQR